MTSPRFVFNDELTFESLIQQLDTYDIDSFLNTLSPYHYQSFYNRTGVQLDSIDTFDEPVLEAILNAYGVVEIDGYLIKMHPTWDVIYVLPNTASPADQQTFERAASDIDLDDIRNQLMVTTMSIECDFFGIIDNGDGTYVVDFECDTGVQQSDPCKGSCGRGKQAFASQGYCSYFADIEVRYRNYGIWRTLKMKFTHTTAKDDDLIGKGVKIDRSISAYWRGKKCKPDDSYSERFNGFSGGGFLSTGTSKTFHSGTRCLIGYNLTATVQFIGKCGGTVRTVGPVSISR